MGKKKSKTESTKTKKSKGQQSPKGVNAVSENACHCCGSKGTEVGGFLLECNACKKAYYCSVQCFNDHLPKHLEFCQTSALPSKSGPLQQEQTKSKGKAPSGSGHNETKSKTSEEPKQDLSPVRKSRKVATVKRTFVDTSCSESETETESVAARRRRVQQKNRTKSPGKSPTKKTVVGVAVNPVCDSESEGEIISIEGPQGVADRPIGKRIPRQRRRGRKRNPDATKQPASANDDNKEAKETSVENQSREETKEQAEEYQFRKTGQRTKIEEEELMDITTPESPHHANEGAIGFVPSCSDSVSEGELHSIDGPESVRARPSNQQIPKNGKEYVKRAFVGDSCSESETESETEANALDRRPKNVAMDNQRSPAQKRKDGRKTANTQLGTFAETQNTEIIPDKKKIVQNVTDSRGEMEVQGKAGTSTITQKSKDQSITHLESESEFESDSESESESESESDSSSESDSQSDSASEDSWETESESSCSDGTLSNKPPKNQSKVGGEREETESSSGMIAKEAARSVIVEGKFSENVQRDRDIDATQIPTQKFFSRDRAAIKPMRSTDDLDMYSSSDDGLRQPKQKRKSRRKRQVLRLRRNDSASDLTDEGEWDSITIICPKTGKVLCVDRSRKHKDYAVVRPSRSIDDSEPEEAENVSHADSAEETDSGSSQDSDSTGSKERCRKQANIATGLKRRDGIRAHGRHENGSDESNNSDDWESSSAASRSSRAENTRQPEEMYLSNTQRKMDQQELENAGNHAQDVKHSSGDLDSETCSELVNDTMQENLSVDKIHLLEEASHALGLLQTGQRQMVSELDPIQQGEKTFAKPVSIPEWSDEDSEEETVRRKRGGGLVNLPVLATENSQAKLFDICTKKNKNEFSTKGKFQQPTMEMVLQHEQKSPEWTEANDLLRRTEQGEIIKKEGTLYSPKKKRDKEKPFWLEKSPLRASSKGALIRSEESVRLNDSLARNSANKPATSENTGIIGKITLRKTERGQMLKRGESIRIKREDLKSSCHSKSSRILMAKDGGVRLSKQRSRPCLSRSSHSASSHDSVKYRKTANKRLNNDAALSRFPDSRKNRLKNGSHFKLHNQAIISVNYGDRSLTLNVVKTS
jgi:hypothetical protein